AQVSADFGDANTGMATLTYSVDRGSRHRVAQVTINGNVKMSSAVLMPQVLLKPAHFLSRGQFSNDLLQRSVTNLQAFYRNYGFADATVVPSVEKRGANLFVSFSAREGDQTIVDSLRLEGNRSQRFETAITVGAPYSPARVNQDRTHIL